MANFFHRRRRTIGSRDRRFLSETVYSAFRHKSFLSAWLQETKGAENAEILVLFAAAAENLLSSDEFRNALEKTGGPAVSAEELYKDLRDKKLPPRLEFASREGEWAVRFSFPEWLLERWFKRYGEQECRKLLEICQERPPLVVRANLLKTSRAKLMGYFRKKGYEVAETKKSSTGIVFARRENLFDGEEFREGLFEVQDEGSQLLCEAVHPQPGEVIWDVCAGGGGKSLAFAASMQNKGRIIATDIRSWKLDELKRRAVRAGIYNIFPADLASMDTIREMKGGADKILVDAPCSGTGTLRRNPDARWKLSEEKIRACRDDQIKIVQKALPYLKKCGKLFYATCSLEPEENEEVVRLLMEKNEGVRLVKADGNKPSPQPSPRGRGENKEKEDLQIPSPYGRGQGEGDSKIDEDGFLRFLPQRDGTDGFFMAVFEKN